MTKNRADGEGSLYQRADGKWIAEITWWEGETRRRRKSSANTRAAAVAAMAQLKSDREAGATRDSARLTVATLLRDWLPKEAKPRVRPRTLAGYTTICEQHIVPELGRTNSATSNQRRYATTWPRSWRPGLAPSHSTITTRYYVARFT